MEYVIEEFYKNIPGKNEEVCGDHVEILKQNGSTIIVLSDGLGSGIKANILATLTSKIAIGLFNKDLPLKEIIETIIDTLPICETRGIAYSTLAVLIINEDGNVRLIEMDTPFAFYYRNDMIKKIDKNKINIRGKTIYESNFKMGLNDRIFLASDGVVHAGIGGLLDFGLGWEGTASHLEELSKRNKNMEYIIEHMLNICRAYYFGNPADDITLIGIQFRKQRKLTILTGPPQKEEDDKIVVNKLINTSGKKAICGGTTAQIAARELGQELKCELGYFDKDVPPIGHIEGIDMVTDGLLTLNKVLDYLRDYKQGEMFPKGNDGASCLMQMLLNSDRINLIVGRSMNESHQSLNLPLELGIRSQIVDRIASNLKRLNKRVKIEWY
ncbi:MAG: SpoIIE family protein phosphatase [Bacillota bacterium]